MLARAAGCSLDHHTLHNTLCAQLRCSTRRSNKYWDSIGTGLDQSKTLLRHEAEYEERRRGDERLLQELPIPREPGGQLDHHKCAGPWPYPRNLDP